MRDILRRNGFCPCLMCQIAVTLIVGGIALSVAGILLS